MAVIKRAFKPKRKISSKRKTYSKSKIHYSYLKKTFKPRQSLVSIAIKNNGVIPTFHSTQIGTDKSYFARKMLKMYGGAAPNMQNRFTATQTYLGPNVQNYFLFSIYSVTDMANCQSLLGTNLGGTGTLNNTARTFYQSVHNDLEITNSSNAPILIDLYFLKCKRDTAISPTVAWLDGIKDQNGNIDQTTYIGVSPLDSKYLTTLYQCKRIHHLTLAAGQCHREQITYHKNSPINNEILNNVSGNVALAGWTYYILGVARGTPIAASTASNVATSGSNIDMTFNETYCVKQINDQKINYSYATVSSALGTASNIYNQGSGTATLAAVI